MKQALLLAAALSLVAGCTAQPIYQIKDASTRTHSGDFKPSEQQVEQAIMLGALRQGWVPERIEPGLIQAKMSLRNYQANVAIPYSANHYSIHHRSSEQLDDQDGPTNTHYNRWVMNLSSSIRQQLNAQAFEGTAEGGQIR